ncbi:hypothetical protein OE88DRAFT_1627124 [Heliocybe sulcata]|uniref:S-adenosyl-L-methionine-dependent methyltransferase n=1 Tax=Heliocybe sulcata TaxID=5364 RepID=A0A5C3N8E3_9AGAM|nr:hypothetical protein OE88DRAFT_1627124 [Heliocybe sulcata]
MAQTSELSSLLHTLTASIDILKAEFVRQGVPEPSLCTSRPHPLDHISYLSPPRMYEAQRAALGCLDRLRLLVENPFEAVVKTSFASGEMPGLRLAAQLDLHEILEEAEDPETGEQLQVIAAKTGTNCSKLGSIRRLLITHRWFRETKPGYFANSRRSHTLKKGSQSYYVAKNMTYFVHGSASKIPDLMTHPDERVRMSRDPASTGWNLYTNTPLPVFGAGGLLDTDSEEAEKFALAVAGFGSATNNAVVRDVPWIHLAKDMGAIVDVGGGQGTLCCDLAIARIKSFIVQDLPSLKGAADKHVASRGLSNLVKFEGQNFFEPNRRHGTGSYVFVLADGMVSLHIPVRHTQLMYYAAVVHAWSDVEAARILDHLRDCLTDGKSKLLVIDSLVYPVTVSSDGRDIRTSLDALSGKDQYVPIPPPPFLPQEYGDNRQLAHNLNVCLLAFCNSFVRTYDRMEHLARLAGMRIKAVHATR